MDSGVPRAAGEFQRNKITLIAKVTRRCNFSCPYCYDDDPSGHEPARRPSLPIEEAVDVMARAARSYESVSMIWHGGEPMLMGLDYYRAVIEAQQRITSESGCTFLNALQSNGHFVDAHSAGVLTDLGFRVGLSYDGLWQDERRGHAESVRNALLALRQLKESVGAICVVTPDDLSALVEQSQHFNSLGVGLQLNPLFESGRSRQSLLAEGYIDAMKDLCSHWLRDTKCRVRVDPLVTYVRMLLGQGHGFCEHNSCLGRYLSVSPDGTLNPCGRPFPSQYSMGHFSQYDELHWAFSTEQYGALLTSAVARRRVCADTCDVYAFCRGGCSQQAATREEPEVPGGPSCIFIRNFLPWLAQELSRLSLGEASVNPMVERLLVSADGNRAQVLLDSNQ